MEKWFFVPFLPVVSCYIAGMIVATIDWLPVNGLNTLLVFGVSCPLVFLVLPFFKRSAPVTFALLLASLCLGTWRTQQWELRLARHDHQLTGTFAGTVMAMSERSRSVRLQVKIGAVRQAGGEVLNHMERVLLYLPLTEAPYLSLGDELIWHGQLQPIRGPGNPAAFNLQAHWKKRDVVRQSFAGRTDYCLLYRPKVKLPLRLRYQGWQRQLSQYMEDTRLSPAFRPVLQALVLGDKSGLTDEMRALFSRSGAIHVLAVSGLHLGFVYGILSLVLRWLPAKAVFRLTRVIFMLVGLWSFVVLTGCSPSAIRAALLISLIDLGQCMNRRGNSFNTLGAAAMLMLFWHPGFLWEVGFQLSFAAVAGILYFYPRLIGPLRHRKSWWAYPVKMIALSCAAQLTTAPLILFYFGNFPTYFWLSSCFAVPLAGILLPLGLLAVGLCAIGYPQFAGYCFQILDWLLYCLVSGVEWTQNLPAAVQSDWYLQLPEVIGFYVLLLVTGWWRDGHRFFAWLLLSLVFAAAGAYYLSREKARSERSGFIVYHVGGTRVVDLVSGRHCWTLPGAVDESRLGFGVAPYRRKMGLHPRPLYLTQSSLPNATSFGQLSWDHHTLIELYSIGVVQLRSRPIRCDALLPGKNFRGSPDAALRLIHPSCLVLDGALDWQMRARWKKAAKERGIAVHDTQKQGAYFLWSKKDR